MIIILFFIFSWYFGLFFQTFYHHRYSAHQMFTMNRFWEKFFFFMSWISQGPSYLSPKVYGILHRMHHAYADTPKDVHSPKYDKTLIKMMWKTKKIYSAISSGDYEYDADKFEKDIPTWDVFDKFASGRFSRIMWVIVYALIYAFFATHWWLWLLFPIHVILAPVHGAVINWGAHKWGYTNFKVEDTSTNLLPFDFLMWGESYHNNHHANGSNPNFGVKWHELDPTYLFIRLFNALGIIHLKS